MTRSLRRWHIRFWLILGPLIAIGLLVALIDRPPAPAQTEIQPVLRHPDRSAIGTQVTMNGRDP